jgi:hypothetical protein
VPDHRIHRGPHPEDERLFSAEFYPVLRQAAGDLCWLLSRGYASESSLKLVGDRYTLVARQRVAVARCACSDQQARRRSEHQVELSALKGRDLWLDGYNVLTTLEAALAGGVILAARDGTCRDMASMHGTYRQVTETVPALEILGRVLQDCQVSQSFWYLDRPVSNSGRLKKTMEALAAAQGWTWEVELVPSPDALLFETPEIVATADSIILDRCPAWYNLAAAVIRREIPQAWLVDLRFPLEFPL